MLVTSTNDARPLSELSAEELSALATTQRDAHAAQAAKGTKLDVTRGKPSAAQLDLADEMLSLPTATKDRAGTDVRNYGGLSGLAELREIFAELLWVEPEQIIAGGNSSLSMMRDVLVDLLLFGAIDSPARGRRRTRSPSSARSPATTVTSRCWPTSGSR